METCIGVTRDSVLTLARASGKFVVSERWVPIAEIYEAALENRVSSMNSSIYVK